LDIPVQLFKGTNDTDFLGWIFVASNIAVIPATFIICVDSFYIHRDGAWIDAILLCVGDWEIAMFFDDVGQVSDDGADSWSVFGDE